MIGIIENIFMVINNIFNLLGVNITGSVFSLSFLSSVLSLISQKIVLSKTRAKKKRKINKIGNVKRVFVNGIIKKIVAEYDNATKKLLNPVIILVNFLKARLYAKLIKMKIVAENKEKKFLCNASVTMANVDKSRIMGNIF